MADLIKLDNSSDSGDKNVKRSRLIASILVSIPILYAVYKLLPYAVNMVSNAADFVAMSIKLGISLAGAYILWLVYKGLRGTIGHAIEKLNYRILDALIASRPTESMRIEIAKAEENRRIRTQGLAEMITVVKDMETRRDSQADEAMRELRAASSFKSQREKETDNNKKIEFERKETLARNSATYKKESNDRMKDSYEKYTSYVERMKKLADAMDFFIQDRNNLCNQLEQDWLYSRKMRKAAGTVNQNLALMDDNSIYMRAGRIAQEEIKNNISYVEAAFENSKSVMDKADLEKGIINESSKELLNRYESGEFDQVIEMMSKQSSLEDLKVRARYELKNPDAVPQEQLASPTFSELYQTESKN